MDKTKKQLIEELDILHSGIMALEELLIKKRVITLNELNSVIKKCHKECKEKRSNSQKPKISK